jgi:preprotein translocase subunit YajC
MSELVTMPALFVLAQQTGQPSFLIQLFPFALILLIFYFLVLLPMRRRQKKVVEFQAGLKVGDKIITTGGIYGQITRLSDNSVQVQIADKVKIEVARAAVGGYQGQEPVVQTDTPGTT